MSIHNHLFVLIFHLGNGKGVHFQRGDISIKIPPGIPEGHKIIIEGGGHEALKMKPGNLVIHVTSQPHSVFRRDGHNLRNSLKISLRDSLLGFNKSIQGIDGKAVYIFSPPSWSHHDIVPHKSILETANQGLPIFLSNDDSTPLDEIIRGSLFTEMLVQFPKLLTPKEKEAIRSSFSQQN